SPGSLPRRQPAHRLRLGHPFLPGRAAGARRGPDRDRHPHPPAPAAGARRGPRRVSAESHAARAESIAGQILTGPGAMDRVRLAIVGCGTISQLTAPGYLQHPRCDVVALCAAGPERAPRRAREWGISPRIYSDFKQVLEDPAIDAVELLTPTWMHADQIV